MSVRVEVSGVVTVVTIDRPDQRNAVDRPTAHALAAAFRDFDQSDSSVAVLTGAGGTFCAGADLKALSDPERVNRTVIEGDGPMGPSRLDLSKPVLAAIEGHAVAGGLELAVWCDLRVASETAILGVFCRRWGVPLIDGGTVRLPRLIGHGRAMDMILTGRAVGAEEALRIGLVDRVVPADQALASAIALAEEIAGHPQRCVLSDRRSAIDQWDLSHSDAMAHEFTLGMETIASGETATGAQRFAAGAGRHGSFGD